MANLVKLTVVLETFPVAGSMPAMMCYFYLSVYVLMLMQLYAMKRRANEKVVEKSNSVGVWDDVG